MCVKYGIDTVTGKEREGAYRRRQMQASRCQSFCGGFERDDRDTKRETDKR